MIRKLFTSEGRAGRLEYFLHTVLDGAIAGAIIAGMTHAAKKFGFPQEGIQALAAIVLGIAAWSEWAVTVRRLADLGRPQWHWLLMLIPIYNLFLSIELLFSAGTSSLPKTFTHERLNPGQQWLREGMRFDSLGDYDHAFECYKHAIDELQGEPEADAAIKRLQQLQEKLTTGG